MIILLILGPRRRPARSHRGWGGATGGAGRPRVRDRVAALGVRRLRLLRAASGRLVGALFAARPFPRPRLSARRSLVLAGAAGALAGVALLSKSIFVVLVPAALVLVAWGAPAGSRLRRALAAAAGRRRSRRSGSPSRSSASASLRVVRRGALQPPGSRRPLAADGRARTRGSFSTFRSRSSRFRAFGGSSRATGRERRRGRFLGLPDPLDGGLVVVGRHGRLGPAPPRPARPPSRGARASSGRRRCRRSSSALSSSQESA